MGNCRGSFDGSMLEDIWVIKLLPISNIPGLDSFGVVVTGSISKRCWPGPWYRIMVATNRCDPSSIPNGFELKWIFRGESVGMVLYQSLPEKKSTVFVLYKVKKKYVWVLIDRLMKYFFFPRPKNGHFGKKSRGFFPLEKSAHHKTITAEKMTGKRKCRL